MRRLIINADDFGLTSGINRAVMDAHFGGVVTSTTLMANAPAFAEASHLPAQAPRLGVGCHVVLLDGSPLLPPQQIKSLVNPRSNGERLSESLGSFAARAFAGSLDPREIESEATAQIRKVQSAGMAVTHVDTHKHAHVFPLVWRALLRSAQACGIRALRNPFVPRHALRLSDIIRRPDLWKRELEVFFLRSVAHGFRRAVRDAGMITTDGCLGIVETGALDLPLFQKVVSCIPEGTWEFVCHPGYYDQDLDHVGTRLRQSRALELQVLTSSQAREAIDRQGIELISYRELVA